jgi:hypothetical protein
MLLPRSLVSTMSMVYGTPLIFWASIGVASKFGNCSDLHYSGRAIHLTFLNLRASRCQINQDPGDWYLMAAYARHHLLPFGNYTLHYLADLSLEKMGSDKKNKGIGSRETRACVPGSSLRSSLAIFIYGYCGSSYLSYKSDWHRSLYLY